MGSYHRGNTLAHTDINKTVDFSYNYIVVH